jgi:hypothetical protein
MKLLCLFLVAAVWARSASLRGAVTDPSGAAVPGALVQLRGPGGNHRAVTGGSGEYEFAGLEPGKYQLRITAKDFAAVERRGLAISKPMVFDVQLAIEAGKETITVADAAGAVSASPDSNGAAVLLGRRQIAELSDDPDELALQLQALAGPAPGPNGGQLYIDGFDAASLPPKSAIREIRINSNPFSPEYDRPGFARIDIFTKPGSDAFHGQGYFQYNDQLLNSRNPLLAQSARPPYQVRLYGLDVGGPLRKGLASFTVSVERRQIDESALILATTPSGSISEALAAPQVRTSIAPRADIALGPRNTLTARYQDLRIEYDNQGVGDFSLPSRAYRERQTEQTMQLTETATLSPRAINETRFQYLRSTTANSGAVPQPSVDVIGAFSAGGASIGNSGTVGTSWQLIDVSTFNVGSHMLKWGGRFRRADLDDTSYVNFLGTFTFYTLDQYAAGTPAQFSINSGTPATRVGQTDVGLFAGDDWRIRPNLTVSLGLRYEAQTVVSDLADWAPRVGVAWGIGAGSNRPLKTVLRAGAGVFYDRLNLATLLAARRYDGIAQQSYLVLNPAFYPAIPSLAVLQAQSQPQQLRPLYAGLRAPRLYQTNLSLERQLSASSKITLSWLENRGLHLPNSRNINAPIDGANPFGDRSIRLLSEDAGLSRQRQVVANLNINRKGFNLFGYYALSYGKDDNEGQPADPYNLRGEWGPSTYGDVRHRGVAGSTVTLPWKFSLSPFLVANSGAPYNITTGLDPFDTGVPTARPALTGPAGCVARACFDANPAPGVPVISRDYGRGPVAVNLGLRASRTWSFGRDAAGSGPAQISDHQHTPGPQMMSQGAAGGKRYNLTLSASSLNSLNRTNLAPPDGDLASPYFGQSRALGGMVVMMHGGGASSYNRKIDVQLRFAW